MANQQFTFYLDCLLNSKEYYDFKSVFLDSLAYDGGLFLPVKWPQITEDILEDFVLTKTESIDDELIDKYNKQIKKLRRESQDSHLSNPVDEPFEFFPSFIGSERNRQKIKMSISTTSI